MSLLVTGFCEGTASIWGVLGYLVIAIKIIIPLMLIILGMVDLGKAVISSDEKAINKSVSSLIKRFVAAIVVFFVPTIVSALFNAITGFNIGGEADSRYCVECLLNRTGTSLSCTSKVGVTGVVD